MRRYVGLLWAVVAAVAWGVLAHRTPTSTFHFAPLVVAGVWVIYDGYSEAGVTQRQAVNEAVAGFVVALVATVTLELLDDLSGPVFWQSGPDAPVVLEHLLFAAGGAIVGVALALRRASRAPVLQNLDRK